MPNGARRSRARRRRRGHEVCSRAASHDVTLEPADNARLANLCGQLDEHLRQIERRLGVEIANRGNRFRVSGEPQAATAGSSLLKHLFDLTKTETLSPERVHYALQELGMRAGEAQGVRTTRSRSRRAAASCARGVRTSSSICAT